MWNGVPPNADKENSSPHWLRYKGSYLVLYQWCPMAQTWAYFGVSGTDGPYYGPSCIAELYDYVAPCTPPRS